MKLTKKLAAIAACACMAATSMVGMGASAKSTIKTENHSSNLLSYSTSYYGDFSKLSAQVYAGTISATNSDYDQSWKNISYITYTESGGRYSVQKSSGDSGTGAAVSCSNTQVNSATARREYVSTMRKTSDSSSSAADTYVITYNK